MDVGLLSDLADSTLGINGFGGVFSQPLGYIIKRIHVEGVWGYDNDQLALVIPDSTIFGSQVLVTLGTLSINWIINVIKKAKSVSCQLLDLIGDSPVVDMSASRNFGSEQAVDLINLNEVVKTTKKEEIDALLFKIIHGQTKHMLLVNNMHVMTRFLKGGDGSHLPHNLSVVNTYTEVTSGSKGVPVVVKNLMAILLTITKCIKIT